MSVTYLILINGKEVMRDTNEERLFGLYRTIVKYVEDVERVGCVVEFLEITHRHVVAVGSVKEQTKEEQ